MPVCLHSDCTHLLRSSNRTGYCKRHHSYSDRARKKHRAAARTRYHSDTAFRERERARHRKHLRALREDPEFRLQMRDYQRRRRSDRAQREADNAKRRTDAERERRNARSRERYRSEPAYRDRKRERAGTSGVRRWAIPLSQWQFNRCGICREPMGLDISIDHIVPRAKGGGDELENLQAVHRSCNSRKRDGYDLFAVSGVSA